MAVKVGYQGKHGTFSEIAVLEYFKDQDIEPIGFTNFKDIFNACDHKEIDYALLPVENTTTGIISRTYDLFKYHEVFAIGEINIPIREDLIVVPGTKLEEIEEVYSHPEALSQCTKFFSEHSKIQAIAYQDTAKSVEYIKECNTHTKAALGSKRAAEYYHMESLLSSVQDSNSNITRFLCVTRDHTVLSGANKTSLMLILKHQPGELYHILGILAKYNINLLKLESRPIPNQIFHYCFYIDFEGNINDPATQDCLRVIKEHSEQVQVLGCYKAAKINA